jgi:hypothetical protein
VSRPPKHIQQKQLWFAAVTLRNEWHVQNLTFSNESRFVLNGDKGYVWKRRCEYNASAMGAQWKAALESAGETAAGD